jgi:AcrR family transcriptional regulator
LIRRKVKSRVRHKKRNLAAKSSAVDRRTQRLISKATEVFLQYGYDGTSMELIADRAEMTRRTVYNYFPGKDELFARIVEGHFAHLMQRMNLEQDVTASAGSQLVRYCNAVATEMIRVQRLAEVRLLMDVAKRFPELAHGLRGSTTEIFVDNLAQHLEHFVVRKQLEIPDVRQAALILIAVSMLPMLRAMTGVAGSETIEPAMLGLIKETVEMFCLRYQPRSKSVRRVRGRPLLKARHNRT